MSLSFSYKCAPQTISCMIKEGCEALINVLCPISFPDLNAENFKKVAKGFEVRWNLPNCIGTIDGRHMRIQVSVNIKCLKKRAIGILYGFRPFGTKI